LRGAGRAWIKRTIKQARKKERQRKKRNIDNTNLRASVRDSPDTELYHLVSKYLGGRRCFLILDSGDQTPTHACTTAPEAWALFMSMILESCSILMTIPFPSSSFYLHTH
jgi:hypothetical protein